MRAAPCSYVLLNACYSITFLNACYSMRAPSAESVVPPAYLGYPSDMMVDIHCHILAGLDDGASSLEESLEMAEMAVADGTTHLVGTPHSNREYRSEPQRVRERRDELQNALQEKLGNRLTLATGCDFHLSYENIQ